MSKENNGFNWKDSVTLKEYFDIRLKDIELATILARESMEKRLEGMNEFRETLRDQQSRFISRNEHEVMMTKYDSDIRSLRESRSLMEGKASQSSVNIATIIAIIGIVIGLLSITFRMVNG